MLCIIRRRGDQCRRYKLIARLCYSRMSDRQPHSNARANGTATPGKAKSTYPEANGWWGIIEHVRSADDRETDGGITAAILANQDSLGCRLKSTGSDMYCIFAGVVNGHGAIGGRELRPCASRQGHKSRQDYRASHRGRNACERRAATSTMDDEPPTGRPEPQSLTASTPTAPASASGSWHCQRHRNRAWESVFSAPAKSSVRGSSRQSAPENADQADRTAWYPQ